MNSSAARLNIAVSLSNARQLAEQNKNRLAVEAPADLGPLTVDPMRCGKSCSIC
jgi:hypothetical protein